MGILFEKKGLILQVLVPKIRTFMQDKKKWIPMSHGQLKKEPPLFHRTSQIQYSFVWTWIIKSPKKIEFFQQPVWCQC